MIYVKITDKIVTDTIVLPDGEGLEYIQNTLGLDGYWIASNIARIGDIYENGGIISPPEAEHAPIVPQAVTRRQARLALLEVGKLDDFEGAIAAIEEPTERRAAEIEYEADTWERSNEFLQTMWAQLGGAESELDELFTLAAGL